MKSKYDISIVQKEGRWLAIMVCNCGQTPETTALEGDDLRALLHNVGTTLAKHEEKGK